MGVYYNRNAGLALDADLALLVVDAGLECGVAQTHILSETQDFSDPHLKWNAKLLRLVLGIERGVTHTRVGWDAELLRLVERGFTQTHV